MSWVYYDAPLTFAYEPYLNPGTQKRTRFSRRPWTRSPRTCSYLGSYCWVSLLLSSPFGGVAGTKAHRAPVPRKRKAAKRPRVTWTRSGRSTRSNSTSRIVSVMALWAQYSVAMLVPCQLVMRRWFRLLSRLARRRTKWPVKCFWPRQLCWQRSPNHLTNTYVA